MIYLIKLVVVRYLLPLLDSELCLHSRLEFVYVFI